MKSQCFNSNRGINLSILLVTIGLSSPLTTNAKTVNVSPSTDSLASALASAGAGGTVVLRRGNHIEHDTVQVTVPVTILGEQGAIILSGTSPSMPPYPLTVVPVLYVQNASDVTVQNISFKPLAQVANCAVLVENSPRTQILDNQISGFEFGIFSQSGDRVVIQGNQIATSRREDLPETDGIIANSGVGVQVADNDVSSIGSDLSSDVLSTGIFLSGHQGYAHDNTASGCKFGFVTCHNTPGFYKNQAGVDLTGDVPATGWLLEDNHARGNAWGYIVVDGSNHNILVSNGASNNGQEDISLGGTYFPLLGVMPESVDNLVVQYSPKGLSAKDCGQGNVILGRVTLKTDPCPQAPPTPAMPW